MKKCLLALVCSFFFTVLAAADTVVYDFYAPWCGPCKQFEPVFESWKKKWETDKVKFMKVNVDENKKMTKEFNIRMIPTVVVVKDGKEIFRFVGIPNESVIKELLK